MLILYEDGVMRGSRGLTAFGEGGLQVSGDSIVSEESEMQGLCSSKLSLFSIATSSLLMIFR